MSYDFGVDAGISSPNNSVFAVILLEIDSKNATINFMDLNKPGSIKLYFHNLFEFLEIY